MSLVTLIRDYVDVANSSKQLDGYTLSSLAYYTFIFLFTVIKQALVYCFTFHWLRDLSYFCFTPPLLLSSFSSLGLVNGIASQDYHPLSNLLAFSDSNFSTGIGIVFLGFLNGCFSCMHLSAANLVTIQRMLVQGVPAGLSSAFGTAVGQLSFLTCILFGFRGLLFPWLVLEPLHFLLGTTILLIIASTAAQDRRTSTVQWSTKSTLLMYVFTSIALTWCEQTAIFQWMGNISLGTEPTFLETTPSLETIPSVLGNVQHLTQSILYLLAFFLGSLLGAFLLGYGLQRLLESILRYKGIAIYYGLVKQANLPLATLIFAFGFGSLPYYGFDYLVTKGFGFIPNENIFQQTLFSPTNLVSKTSQAKEPSQGRLEDQLALLFTLEGERSKSFAVDTAPFDDGQYLKAGQKRPQSFEDLNYRGEHLWTNRLSRISNIREQANQTQSSFLGPIFSWMRSFLWGDGSTGKPLDKRQTQLSEGMLEYDEVSISKHDGEQTILDSNISKDQHEQEAAYPHYQEQDQKEKRSREKTHFSSNKIMSPEKAYEVGMDNIKQKIELSSESEQVDNYVKEFDRQFDKGFSNFYNADPQSLIEVEDQWQEKRIKEKCYTNPIYTFLLNTEIDAFLKRQPDSHWLSPREEVLLLKRRQLLNSYYDTLALTSQVSTSEALNQLVPKSYANTIYNHQFKGTLKVARRLFSLKKVSTNFQQTGSQSHSITSGKLEVFPSGLASGAEGLKKVVSQNALPTSEYLTVRSLEDNLPSRVQQNERPASFENQKVGRAVKFDQPLFSNEKYNIPQIVFHEELSAGSKQNDDFQSGDESAYPSVAYPPKEGQQKQGEKIVGSSKANSTVNSNIFLLEQAEPLPLYAGWDQGLRKLILTNRFQNRALAGYTISEFPINSIRSKVATGFTTWPIPNPFSENKDFLTNSELLPSEHDFGSEKQTSYAKLVSARAKRGSVQNEFDENAPNYSHPLSRSSNSSLINGTANNESDRTTKDSDKLDELSFSARANSDLDVKNDSSTLKKSERRNEKLKNDQKDKKNIFRKPIKFLKNSIDKLLFHQYSKNQFLFQSRSFKEPATNDMANALLQWQKLIKENKQLSKEDKQIAKEKVSYWPKNLNRANWSTELVDNDIEFEEPNENLLKKQTLLWEFTPPNHGGFLWPGSLWNK